VADKEVVTMKENEMMPIDPDATLNMMERTMEKFLSTANVEAVYGKPVKQGENLIIPASESISVFGFGLGGGSGGFEDEDGGGSGIGGGGGGRVFSRPVAVLVASPDGVRVEPVVDLTKIALAGLTAGAFMLGMVFRMLNPKKALKDIQEGTWT